MVIAIAVIDWIGLSSTGWFESAIPRVTLIAIGVVLLASFVERITIMRALQRDLSLVSETTALGARYLVNSQAVVEALKGVVDGAVDKVLAVGGKSTAEDYLQRIERKVIGGEITYSRVLTGNHITHELHDHLQRLMINDDTVRVAWNPSEKYGHVTISEHQVVFAIPTPNPVKFKGLRLAGMEHSGLFTEVFWEAFNEERGVRFGSTESLTFLCERCSPQPRLDESTLRDELVAIERRGTLGAAATEDT